MPRLYAQPYDISATGFYFDDIESYRTQARDLRNDHGHPVEEFEIQFIDGDRCDCELARAIGLSQVNLAAYLECCDKWEDWQKLHVTIAVGSCGHDFDPDVSPDHYDLDIYCVDNLRAFAEQLVDDGLLGEVPDNIRPYFDYDAFACDLSVEYTELTLAGERLVYRAS